MQTFKIIALIFFAISSAAQAAASPQQLHNKSITIGWGEAFVSKRVSDNVRVSGNSKFEVIVYVSSAGRAFARAGGGTDRHSFRKDQGPENTTISFNGTTMTAVGGSMEMARRITATFDPSFTSCTASVTVGKMKEGARLIGFDGAQYEMIQKIPNAMSCSVSAGNKFGG